MPETPTEELGKELYELMLGPSGASVDAIQRKSRIMSLSCIRVGSAAVEISNPTSEALARRAREILTDATNDLVKPPPERELVDTTDLGAAARCFLALEKGTESLVRRDRRLRADLYTGDRSISAMAKTQKKPYRVSHERKLMNALAEKVMGREFDYGHSLGRSAFARSFMDDVFPTWPPTPLLHYYRAWFIADLLPPQLEYAVDCVRRISSTDHKDEKCPVCALSLTSCARLTDISEDIQNPDSYRAGAPRSFPARIALAEIQTNLPFDVADRVSLRRSITTASDAKHFAAMVDDELFVKWDSWLRGCRCTFSEMHVWPREYAFCADEIDPACQIHRALIATVTYARAVQSERRNVQRTQETAEFKQFYLRSEDELLSDIGLRILDHRP